MTSASRTCLLLAAVAAAATGATAAPAASCQAATGAFVTPVVELYTSEGCNSCPPADRWLSRLPADAPTVALAFHVDYWDRLGWKDRFASALHTQRQAQLQQSSGAGFSYTPQVVVDGLDRKDWDRLATPPAGPARGNPAVTLTLSRAGDHFSASVMPRANLPMRLAAYWAVTEQGHVSAVQAGENQGVTLHHDHVVREYRPVAAWTTAPGLPTTLQFDPSIAAEPAHPRDVNLVVVDAATGRPLQALKLGC
jgi:hypothetical protein